jgi:hypothetical protein
MSRLLHFLHSSRASEELARWERSAKILEVNLFLLRERHLGASSIEGIKEAEDALRRARSHLRPAA